MRITWSLPVPGERLGSARGDLVRAARLIEALRAEGHEIGVVEAAGTAGASRGVAVQRRLIARLLRGKASLLLRDLGRLAVSRSHASRVAETARRERAELIVETQVHGLPSGALAARLSGLPLRLDDCSPLAEELGLGCGWPFLLRRGFARQLAAAERIVAVSEEARSALLRDGASERALVIVPNGVALDEFDAATPHREATRRDLGFSGSELVAVFAGSFQPWHRVDALVEALATEKAAPWRLLLVGEGEGLAPALRLGERLGLGPRITSLGRRAPGDVATLLVAADAGLMPGSNEHGHPMKLLEYAAASLPLIAPDTAAVRRLVTDGRQGLIVRSGEPASIARALATLASDAGLRRRLAQAARKELAEPADWSLRARELLA